MPAEPPSAIVLTDNVRRLGPASVDALDQRIEQSHGGRLELIDGILYELPMTSFEHGHISGLLVSMLVPAYQLGRGGPGGWWIQGENDFCANGSEVFRPDAVGWRRANFGGCRSRVSEHPDHLFRSIAITRFGIPIGDFGIAIASFGASRSPKKG